MVSQLRKMHSGHSPSLLRRINPDIAAFVLGVPLAIGQGTVAPFVSNQNTYLLHAVSDQHASLTSDWLASTVDPYPFFSALTSQIYAVSGNSGIRIASLVGTYIAILGTYFIAKALTPLAHRIVPVVTMVLMGLTINAKAAWMLNVVFGVGISPSMFDGVAGQYIVGFYQPALAGSLLLAAVGIWLLAFQSLQRGSTFRILIILAFTFTLFSCMLHPTYLIATVMGFAAAIVLDLLKGGRRRRLLGYGGGVATVVALTILANPSLLDFQSRGEGEEASLSRLAFERIPHHTLILEWSGPNLRHLLLMLLAAWLVGTLTNGKWLRYWLLILITAALISAVTVTATRWAPLALMFPWRISVILVPLSAVIVLTRVNLAVSQRLTLESKWRTAVLGLAVVTVTLSAVPGIVVSMRTISPSVTDTAVSLVKQVQPDGVGLIPLSKENVRLNALVPVFVDWKSHPLTGKGDLEEWWRRIDLVREFEANPESYCDSAWMSEVDWILFPSTGTIPSCLSKSQILGSNSDYLLISVSSSSRNIWKMPKS